MRHRGAGREGVILVLEAVTVGAVVEAVQGVEGVVGEGDLLQGGRQPLNQVCISLV